MNYVKLTLWCGLASSGSGQGPVMTNSDHGLEHVASIKYGVFGHHIFSRRTLLHGVRHNQMTIILKFSPLFRRHVETMGLVRSKLTQPQFRQVIIFSTRQYSMAIKMNL
jgi:hypothetical protein